MNSKKLSKLQKFILQEAYFRGAVRNHDILIHWYGFQTSPRGRLNFNREQIGLKKYLTATTSTAQSLTRLRNRGLMRRGDWRTGHLLTHAGRDAVRRLNG